VRRELGLALLERNEIGRAARRAKAVKERHAELLLVVMIAVAVGVHAGLFAASLTFR
jgi:hypothetical protein